jgi:pseudouridine-5'-phosphate glycosidase
MKSAVLVANPIPAAEDIPAPELEPIIREASRDAQAKRIHGKELTPFLLQRITDLTKGRSMQANLALLLNNARLAAQIAKARRAVERRMAV